MSTQDKEIPNPPAEKMFYIRNEGYLGNALIWWKKNRNGYTCDIRDALQVNEQEAKDICKRPEDSAYECGYIDNLLESHKLIVDCQYVSDNKRLFVKPVKERSKQH